MPDYTNTSYYYEKFSNLSQTSLKNITVPYCDGFSDFVDQWNVSLSSLNLNTLETEAQDQLILQQCETQKRICPQLQRSYTFCTDIESCACHPEQIVICGKPDGKNPNWQDLKCAAQLPEQVKLVSPVENFVTEEPTDGSSTSKSSSSCDRSDIWHSSSTYDKHSRKNSKGPNYGDMSASNSKCQSGGNKAQKKGVKPLGPQGQNPTCNTNSSATKYRPREDESLRQPHKVPNSACLHCHVSPVTDSNKKHNEKPEAPVSKPTHKVGCHVAPHQNGTQKSEPSAKTEVDNNANYQADTSKYDDTARLEIFKLRNRIKRYTEGLDNPLARKSHTFRTQNPNSHSVKISKSKSLPTPDRNSGYQSSSSSKSQFHCAKYPPLIQKSVPQKSHVESVKKKRRNSGICDELPEKQTDTASCSTSSDISSTVSDRQSRESSSDISDRMETYIRGRDIQHSAHFGTKGNVYQKRNTSAKSVPQHTLAKKQMDTVECCTKQHKGNFQLQPNTVKRNQLRRPVPGQKPLYNYEQLSYQASEVYPDLICELEEKLSAINAQQAVGRSVSPMSEQRLKKSF